MLFKIEPHNTRGANILLILYLGNSAESVHILDTGSKPPFASRYTE